MKERWLVTLYVKFITLHKSNIRHYERKYSLMFQKLYSVSLITKQANCKTCYWRWLEWNFFVSVKSENCHFLLIGTTVLFNAQLWRKLFLQQLIFRSKTSHKNKLILKYARFYVFTKKKEISIETFFIIWNIHFKENIKTFALNVDIDSKLKLVDVSNFNCCFSSLINKAYWNHTYLQ